MSHQAREDAIVDGAGGEGTMCARTIAALLGAALACGGCAALEAQGRRNAEAECAQLSQCVVYDDTGRHLSPCWNPPGRWGTIYPGDPQWPFQPGVCPPAPESVADALP
jgi:hypothetical protein